MATENAAQYFIEASTVYHVAEADSSIVCIIEGRRWGCDRLLFSYRSSGYRHKTTNYVNEGIDSMVPQHQLKGYDPR